MSRILCLNKLIVLTVVILQRLTRIKESIECVELLYIIYFQWWKCGMRNFSLSLRSTRKMCHQLRCRTCFLLIIGLILTTFILRMMRGLTSFFFFAVSYLNVFNGWLWWRVDDVKMIVGDEWRFVFFVKIFATKIFSICLCKRHFHVNVEMRMKKKNT